MILAGTRADRRPAAIAFVWGLAEATVFFIVPDVYLSRQAIGSYREGLACCLWALAGALLGGSALFALAHDPGFARSALAFFDRLPGISPAMIDATGRQLQEQGALAFFTRAAAGVPYKLCVVHAATGGMGWPVFLAVSTAARLTRFIAVTFLAGFIARKLLSGASTTAKYRIHLAAWTLFYTFYFIAMRG